MCERAGGVQHECDQPALGPGQGRRAERQRQPANPTTRGGPKARGDARGKQARLESPRRPAHEGRRGEQQGGRQAGVPGRQRGGEGPRIQECEHERAGRREQTQNVAGGVRLEACREKERDQRHPEGIGKALDVLAGVEDQAG